MSAIQTIKIRQVLQETCDAITLVFDPLPVAWRYLPGQFITLRLYLGGRYVHRSYSFCTTPGTDRYPAITIKRIEGGVVSGHLHALAQAGMVLEALPPAGSLLLPRMPDQARHVVLIAGGSGITPLFSLLKATLKLEPKAKVWLIYANRSEEDIIYRSALQDVQRAYPNRLEVTHVLSKPSPSWQGYQGRVTPALLRACLAAIGDEWVQDYFLSAPQGLMEMVHKTLTQWGVRQQHIHQELFSLPPAVKTSQSFTYTLKIDHDGKEYVCHPSRTQTLLEASLEAGLEIPYACMGGTCNTCRAQCVEGRVVMEEDEGLSEEEIKQGYVLTCVARPTTEKVSIKV